MMEEDDDILAAPVETTFYPLPADIDDDALYLNNVESNSNAGGLTYDQSSISDSIGQFVSRNHFCEARVGSAFFTPTNNLCQVQS